MTDEHSEERDQFLTKAMGECWHEGQAYRGYTGPIDCTVCGKEWYPDSNNDFSTGDGFFKLWNWSTSQKWWQTGFKSKWWGMLPSHIEFIPDGMINPDKFADIIYKFLKENE